MTLVDVRFGLVELLTSNASIQGLVSGRVYPMKMKQAETRDSIVYNRITEFESYHYLGPTGLVSARYQFDVVTSADRRHFLQFGERTVGGFRGRVELIRLIRSAM
jgi:hypothetical protein